MYVLLLKKGEYDEKKFNNSNDYLFSKYFLC